jgi:aminopeptidase N
LIKIRSRFDEWVYVLKTSKVRDSFAAAGVQEAGKRLDILKMTPEEKSAYHKTLASEMDYKSQLYTAELKGELKEREKWQIVVDGKDAEIARITADKDAEIARITADKDAEIEQLRRQLLR